MQNMNNELNNKISLHTMNQNLNNHIKPLGYYYILTHTHTYTHTH